MKQVIKIKIFDFVMWHFFVCLPIAGILILIGTSLASNQTKPSEKRQYEINSSLINPLLECGEFENVSNKEVNNIKLNVQKKITDVLNSKELSDIAVYFRDLNNGPWFGIKEDNEFSPASLLKLPLMIALLKQEELNPGFLSTTVEYQTIKDIFVPYFSLGEQLRPGQKYKLAELLAVMIKKSDNQAFYVLNRRVDPEIFYNAYNELGVKFPTDPTYQISVNKYGSFFRILYNATYLNRRLSTVALGFLAETEFNQGLRAGVPANIKVAHKFGERYFQGSAVKQLHDCGIIYHPLKPYVLCIMSKGEDLDLMANSIKEISNIVYNEVDK